MDKESVNLTQAILALLLLNSPIKGDYHIELDGQGEWLVVDDNDSDFWGDSLHYRFEAIIIASLANLGVVSVMDICNVLDALGAIRPDLYGPESGTQVE